MAFGRALKSVLTRFTFDFDGAKLNAVNRTTGRAVTNLSAAARQAQAVKAHADGMLSNFARLGGLFAAGMGIKSITVDFARQADEIDRMSQSLGVSTDFFQGLASGLKTVGFDFEETSQFIADASERMFDASEGSKALRDDFALLGFGAKQLKELAKEGPEAQILALADALQKTGPGAKRTFAAMSGLGDAGAKLLPLLSKGSKGLKEMIADAKRMGVVLDADAIKQAKEFNQQMIRMRQRLNGVRNQIALRVIPAVIGVTDRFTEWAKEGRNVEKMLTAVKVAAGLAAAILAKIVTTFMIAQWVAFKGVIAGVVVWFGKLTAQMVLAKIKLLGIVAVFALLALIIEDLWYFAQGDTSLTERILGRDKDILQGIEDIKATYMALVNDLSTAFGSLWESIVMFAAIFGIRLTTVQKLLKTIGKFLFKVVLLSIVLIGKALAFVVRLVGVLLSVLAHVAAFLVGTLTGAVLMWVDAWESGIEGIKDAFATLAVWAGKVAKAIAGFFSKAADIAKSAWRGLVKLIKDAFRWADRMVQKIAKALGLKKELQDFLAPPKAPGNPLLNVPGSRGARASIDIGSININGTGLDEEQTRRAVMRGIQDTMNNTMRDITPSGTAAPPSASAGALPA